MSGSIRSFIRVVSLRATLASKCFDYQFLVTLNEKGQGIPSGGDKRGGSRVADVTRIIT